MNGVIKFVMPLDFLCHRTAIGCLVDVIVRGYRPPIAESINLVMARE